MRWSHLHRQRVGGRLLHHRRGPRPICPPWNCASATHAPGWRKEVVLLAGLFRALVIWAAAAERQGSPLIPVRPELLEAATWRAAQSGLQGDLVDPVTATPVPAHRLIEQLLAELRPALESVGDWGLVTGLTKSVLARGCSAARQRAARVRGGLRDVVDTLAAETRATPPWLQGTGPARPAVSAAR
jgi:glutamate---cysteine ligase / carboxylate-amine ligase